MISSAVLLQTKNFGVALCFRREPRRGTHVTSVGGLPVSVTATTINRLYGSGMEAILTAARATKAGEAELMIAGGVESMNCAPFVMPNADSAFSLHPEIHDLDNRLALLQSGDAGTIRYRFNAGDGSKRGRRLFHQPRRPRHFALRSQPKASQAQANGRLARESNTVTISQRKGDPITVTHDEQPLATRIEALARLGTT